MRMRVRILTFAGLFALAALILAGCGGSSTSSSSSTSTTSAASTSSGTAATSSPAASPTVASPMASPSPMATPMIASPVASPSVASPMASPAAISTPVNLGSAYSNLESKQSYVMKMTTSGFPQLTALIPGAGSSQQMTLDRSNNDRHLTVQNTGGGKLAELWQVNGKTYADIGTGPVEVGNNGPGAQVAALLGAPKLFLQKMSGNSSAYTITGTATVNGISTTVEKANYTVNNPDIAGLLPAGTHQIQSTIWVANQGQYLVKLQMTITPANASGTPQAGQTPSTVTMNATQIGTAPAVTAPAT